MTTIQTVMAVLRSLQDEETANVFNGRVYREYPNAVKPLTPFVIVKTVSSSQEHVCDGEEITAVDEISVDIYHARASTCDQLMQRVTVALNLRNMQKVGGMSGFAPDNGLNRTNATFRAHYDKWGNNYVY